MRSASWTASSMLCVTISTALTGKSWPSQSRVSSPRRLAAVSTSSAENGSSMSRASGSTASARAKPTLTLQIVRRPGDLHTFQVLPRRWVVERTLAWITRCRRTVRDHERLTAHHETIVYWAMIIIMSRRLARQHQAAQPHVTKVQMGAYCARTARSCARVGCATGGPLPCWRRVSRVHATTSGSV